MTEYTRSANTKVVGRYAIYWARVSENYRQSVQLLRSKRKKRPEPNNLASDTNVKSKGEEEADKLARVVQESEDVLAKASSIFPFVLTRTSVCLDKHKLTIKKRGFLNNDQVISMPIENIKNIQANLGPIFGSLTITSGSLTISSENFVNNTQDINYLWRKDAEKIHKILQGAIVAKTESVDISKVPSSHLKKHLAQLGESVS